MKVSRRTIILLVLLCMHFSSILFFLLYLHFNHPLFPPKAWFSYNFNSVFIYDKTRMKMHRLAIKTKFEMVLDWTNSKLMFDWIKITIILMICILYLGYFIQTHILCPFLFITLYEFLLLLHENLVMYNFEKRIRGK